jgi:GNAT superfamily N-acetyltransferase
VVADPGPGAAPGFTIRVADERDGRALAGLRRAWLEERLGRDVEDRGFDAAFEQWWLTELPRRTFWLAEVGSTRAGWTAVGSINVLEVVQMPRPGARGGRIGQVGNAFVLRSFADRGVPSALLAEVVEHARRRRYRMLLLAPTGSSASFYRRAGFEPAGDRLLVLDDHSDGRRDDGAGNA